MDARRAQDFMPAGRAHAIQANCKMSRILMSSAAAPWATALPPAPAPRATALPPPPLVPVLLLLLLLLLLFPLLLMLLAYSRCDLSC